MPPLSLPSTDFTHAPLYFVSSSFDGNKHYVVCRAHLVTTEAVKLSEAEALAKALNDKHEKDNAQ